MADFMPARRFVQALQEGYSRCAPPGSGVLLAVSGGRDSTALLIASAQLRTDIRLHFEVATVDHGLRGESAQEAEGVRARAEALGFAFHSRTVTVPKQGNLEAHARTLRYRALEDIRRERGLAYVATAHTSTDQAETLLMRLMRGASLRGAAAIRYQRGEVIRPMLGLSRDDCEAFLSSGGNAHFEDAMNHDRRFLRTRVRESLLPAMEELGGAGTLDRLAHFAALAGEDEALLDEMAQRALSRALLPGDALDGARVLAVPSPIRRRLLRRWLEWDDIFTDAKLLARVEAALQSSGRCSLPGGLTLESGGGRLRKVSFRLDAPARVALGRTSPVEFGAWRLWRAPIPTGTLRLRCALGPSAEICIRAPRPKDAIAAGGQTRKVQDLLVDARIPREDRSQWPLLCDANTDQPFWLVGVWPHGVEAGIGDCVHAERIVR